MSLENLGLKQLRLMWEQADDTPGEVVNGHSKGEIYQAIVRVSEKTAKVPKVLSQATQLHIPEVGRALPVEQVGQANMFSETEVRFRKKDQPIAETATGLPIYPADDAHESQTGVRKAG